MNFKRVAGMQDTLLALAREAVAWWENKRPCGWSLEQHLEHPCVNCPFDSDKAMANIVVEWVKKTTRPPRKSVTDSPYRQLLETAHQRNKEIGILIKAARERAGFSQAALGKLTGCTRQMISLIEKGYSGTTTERLEAIRDVLGNGYIGIKMIEVPSSPMLVGTVNDLADTCESHDHRAHV